MLAKILSEKYKNKPFHVENTSYKHENTYCMEPESPRVSPPQEGPPASLFEKSLFCRKDNIDLTQKNDCGKMEMSNSNEIKTILPQGDGNTITSPINSGTINNSIYSAKNYKRLPRNRNWCFTNFDIQNIKWLDNLNIRYYKYGIEICPDTQATHHQGWLQLENEKDLNWMKKLHQSVHFEICKGSTDQNEQYVSKDGNIITKGTFKKTGQRSDLNKVIDDIKEGKYDKFDISYIKFGNNIDKLLELKQSKDSFEKAKTQFNNKITNLYEHQKQWLNLLENQNDRTILWIMDITGNLGKSKFCDYIHYNKNGCLIENGKKSDIACMYNEEEYITFDFCKSTEERVNYEVVEALKNGRIFSPKYNSKVKCFTPPKIICFSNFKPDINKLSIDRWHIMVYKQKHLTAEFKNSKFVSYNAKEKDILDIEDII